MATPGSWDILSNKPGRVAPLRLLRISSASSQNNPQPKTLREGYRLSLLYSSRPSRGAARNKALRASTPLEAVGVTRIILCRMAMRMVHVLHHLSTLDLTAPRGFTPWNPQARRACWGCASRLPLAKTIRWTWTCAGLVRDTRHTADTHLDLPHATTHSQPQPQPPTLTLTLTHTLTLTLTLTE